MEVRRIKMKIRKECLNNVGRDGDWSRIGEPIKAVCYNCGSHTDCIEFAFFTDAADDEGEGGSE